jgi:hypothetical protein
VAATRTAPQLTHYPLSFASRYRLPCLPACVLLQAPSQVKGKPVDDIINEWNSELELRSRSFVKHAEALAQVRSARAQLS